jgi:Tol biopolymer transport system component
VVFHGRIWGDIYVTDIKGESLTNLTNTPSLHNEDAEYSPDGTKIVYKEQVNPWDTPPGKDTEIFIMNTDGTNKVQITNLTDPDSPHYIPGMSHITEMDWSPDGTKIVFGLAYNGGPGTLAVGPHMQSDLYMIFLEDCGNQHNRDMTISIPLLVIGIHLSRSNQVATLSQFLNHNNVGSMRKQEWRLT